MGEADAPLKAAAAAEDSADAVEQVCREAIQNNQLGELNKAITSLLESEPSVNPVEPLAMNLVPEVLNQASQGQDNAYELVELLGRYCNAKEVVLVANEALEHLIREMADPDDDDDDDEEGVELRRLTGICSLYRNAVPRLAVRSVQPHQTLGPIFRDMKQIWDSVAQSLDQSGAQEVLEAGLHLGEACSGWMIRYAAPEGAHADKAILRGALYSIVTSCVPPLQGSISRTVFEERFPRSVPPWRKIRLTESIQRSRALVQQTLKLADTLDFGYDTRLEALRSKEPAEPLAALILLSYDTSRSPPPEALTRSLPLVLACLESDQAVDEVLAWLIRCEGMEGQHLSEEIIVPLTSSLSKFSSINQDPMNRQIGFHMLSLIISAASATLQLELLKELVGDCPFPPMRVAAIGMLKQFVVAALGTDKPSPFGSPTLLPTVTKVLTPDPPDGLDDPELSAKAFAASGELPRLVEALGLYYVVVSRDQSNKTGIRDARFRDRVEDMLLKPLRSCLARWQDDASGLELFPLEAALGRVDDALAKIEIED